MGEKTAIKQNHELSLNSDALNLRKCLNAERNWYFEANSFFFAVVIEDHRQVFTAKR